MYHIFQSPAQRMALAYDFEVIYIVYLQNEQHKPKLRLEHEVSKLLNAFNMWTGRKQPLTAQG